MLNQNSNKFGQNNLLSDFTHNQHKPIDILQKLNLVAPFSIVNKQSFITFRIIIIMMTMMTIIITVHSTCF